MPPVIIGSLITAAPALLPPMTPPAASTARMAASAGVSAPSGPSSARVVRLWLPPVK